MGSDAGEARRNDEVRSRKTVDTCLPDISFWVYECRQLCQNPLFRQHENSSYLD